MATDTPPTTSVVEATSEKKDVDIYRDTFIRYMGYSNEVGEAFRPLVPKSIVAASYGMAIGYVCTDTFDKSLRQRMAGATDREVALVGADVFTWQMFASVIIPGLTINRITAASRMLLRNSPGFVLKTVPTIIGLASIPLIVHPIDKLVDHLMDATYRKVVQ
ncbi:mitochondrial fission process protein 1 [Drosophila grimshawi]|uniref:Mitochondrial fission process protein 1 n=1 Tax=Drosophila grimshawi TaxID=7222 RepID=B4JXD6_DROGR|nr:mitochondrial fission process protein 1 [Drosophila grimshawi]EDV95412.1 GH17931 [Drosophila grimshawi]